MGRLFCWAASAVEPAATASIAPNRPPGSDRAHSLLYLPHALFRPHRPDPRRPGRLLPALGTSLRPGGSRGHALGRGTARPGPRGQLRPAAAMGLPLSPLADDGESPLA